MFDSVGSLEAVSILLKDKKRRCVNVIKIIPDKRLCTTKCSKLSINERHVEAQKGNLVLAYTSDPYVILSSNYLLPSRRSLYYSLLGSNNNLFITRL